MRSYRQGSQPRYGFDNRDSAPTAKEPKPLCAASETLDWFTELGRVAGMGKPNAIESINVPPVATTLLDACVLNLPALR